MDNGVHRFNENVRKGQWRLVDTDRMTGRAFSLPQQRPPVNQNGSIGYSGGICVMRCPSNRTGCTSFLSICLANKCVVDLAYGAVSHNAWTVMAHTGRGDRSGSMEVSSVDHHQLEHPTSRITE